MGAWAARSRSARRGAEERTIDSITSMPPRPIRSGVALANTQTWPSLVANTAAIQNVIDLTRAVRALQADSYIIHRDDLAQLSPYQTRRLKRFGDYTLSLSPPEPFDPELLMPFSLEEQSEAVVVA